MMARETVYDGITFRSRLEATWAAMFDQLDWQFVYEPESDGGYIPDFLIGPPGREYFVEVKPYDVFNADRSGIVRKARKAIGDAPLLVVTDHLWRSSVDSELAFGYIYGDHDDPDAGWDEARFWHNGNRWDFLACWGGWQLRFGGEYDGNAFAESGIVSAATVKRLWSRALNKTRWMPNG